MHRNTVIGGSVAAVAIGALALGYAIFSKEDYETCMVREMRGQSSSMQTTVSKLCARRAHLRLDLKAQGVRPTWSGNWISQIVEAKGYELAEGRFVFSGKDCSESKDEDFKLTAKGEGNGDGAIDLMAMLDSPPDALAPKCMRTVSLYGYYR